MLAKIIQDGLRKHGFHILDIKPIQHGFVAQVGR